MHRQTWEGTWNVHWPLAYLGIPWLVVLMSLGIAEMGRGDFHGDLWLRWCFAPWHELTLSSGEMPLETLPEPKRIPMEIQRPMTFPYFLDPGRAAHKLPSSCLKPSQSSRQKPTMLCLRIWGKIFSSLERSSPLTVCALPILSAGFQMPRLCEHRW